MKKAIILTVIVLTIVIGGYYITEKNKQEVWNNEIITLSPRASYLHETEYIKRKVAQPLEDMILDAEKDGMCLVVASGYRSYERQQNLYLKDETGLVAKPEESEHVQGIAVDFMACPMKDGVRDDSAERLELRNEFSTLPEYQWLKENAERYNFVQSYTADNEEKTGIPAEEWHWKYTGK